MRNLPKAGFSAAIALFLADQISKWAVTKPLGIDSLGDSQTITSFFDLRFVPNIGISLGLLPADGHLTRWALVLLTGAIAVGVAVWMTREKNPADQVALGFVLGGAIGNILDRIRLGYVVDFCDLHIGEWRPFLVFNVADAAITVGVLVLLVRALLVREKPPVENSHA
ncbi:MULTISPECIES: signal peptidase II [unclassified Sphingomonas]|uniref:signal peptidase II n=1 Tax=unclassified Sphingomonas TaxID=196159 RepID=UPI000E748980|nr:MULTISPECIES: signal peptidase II [unclassified Sphingomonas]RKE44696.1 signal peptidase II [Sphingomonas sp. PP-CC-1A-547]TCM06234.1 signal peptidase II [Sphingomonas sp. PP-CC-3G-468]